MLQSTGNHLLNADVHNSILRIQLTLKKGAPQGGNIKCLIKSLLTEAL